MIVIYCEWTYLISRYASQNLSSPFNTFPWLNTVGERPKPTLSTIRFWQNSSLLFKLEFVKCSHYKNHFLTPNTAGVGPISFLQLRTNSNKCLGNLVLKTFWKKIQSTHATILGLTTLTLHPLEKPLCMVLFSPPKHFTILFLDCIFFVEMWAYDSPVLTLINKPDKIVCSSYILSLVTIE